MLNRSRPALKHLVLPDVVTSTWVNARMRELREALTDKKETT